MAECGPNGVIRTLDVIRLLECRPVAPIFSVGGGADVRALHRFVGRRNRNLRHEISVLRRCCWRLVQQADGIGAIATLVATAGADRTVCWQAVHTGLEAFGNMDAVKTSWWIGVRLSGGRGGWRGWFFGRWLRHEVWFRGDEGCGAAGLARLAGPSGGKGDGTRALKRCVQW